MFRKYKTLKHPNAGSIPQPKLSKLKMRFFSTVLIVHVLLCGCNVQPLTIEEIMAKAGSNTYVTIVQSDFRQNAIIKDSTESVEYVNIRDVDTIQLNKILGFNSNERIIIFSREGIYNTYPPISNKDKAKINNSIQLSRMLAQNKNIPSEPYDLLGIASGALCAGGAAIVASCASLGTLSIPALIGAISTVGVASVSIDIATANYEICLKGC